MLPVRTGGRGSRFRLAPEALWLLGFGLAPAVFACRARARRPQAAQRGWLFGAAFSLIGALGVFGLQNGGSLLIAWELMSLGGAVMILSERLDGATGRHRSLHARAARGRRRSRFLLRCSHRSAQGLVARLRDFAGGGPRCRRRRSSVSASCSRSASAPSSACCRSTNGSPAPMARAAGLPARSCPGWF